MYYGERATPDSAFKESYSYTMDLLVDSIIMTKIEMDGD